jgi:hypothetical protein
MNITKNLFRTLLIIACSGLFMQRASASDEKPIRINYENLAKLDPVDQARVLAIAERLETITAMDRSELTSAERKCLRVETRELNREAKAYNRHVGGPVLYISAGTIIIILLIILILA